MRIKKIISFGTVIISAVLLIAIQLFMNTKVYAAGDWQNVGISGISDSSAVGIKTAVDSKGNLYLAYSDAANSNKLTVKKYDGNSWTTIGAAGFSVGKADLITLHIASDDTPYVGYRDQGSSFSAKVSKFNGTNWVQVGAPVVLGINNTSMALDNSDTPYVLYEDISNGRKVSVKKFDGANWVDVGQRGFSAGQFQNEVIAINPKDNSPYVLYLDYGSGSKATVMKFDGNNWANVGGAGFSDGSPFYNSIAFDSKGNPFVAYSDNQYVKVKKYDGNGWVNIGNDSLSQTKGWCTNILLDSKDTIYLGYESLERLSYLKANVKKYDGKNWVGVGASGFSINRADPVSMIIDSNDNLYVAYGDYGNGQKATVKRFVPPVAANGMTAAVSAKTTPAENKVMLTVTPAASDVNHKVYYRIVDADPSAMNVGDVITPANWVEVADTNVHEIVATDGKYVEVVEVTTTDNKVTKWGKSSATNDGYTVPVAASGMTAAVSAKTTPAENKVMLTVTPAASDANHKVYYRVVDANPSTMNVGDVITLANWTEVVDTNSHEITAADGKYVEVVEVTTADNKVTRWGKSSATNDGYSAPVTITAGKGLGRVVTGKPEYANVKIPFTIDAHSFSKKLTSYSFDITYDPTKVGALTVDSFNGLATPTVGAPVADGLKEKVTVTWSGSFTGDLDTIYNSSKGVLFKLNFVLKPTFTSGETPIEVGTGVFAFASGESSNTSGINGKVISGIVYGDVNGDGGITSLDTALINKYVAGKTNAITGEAKLIAADVNGDGSITSADIIEITNYILGKDSTLKTLFGY